MSEKEYIRELESFLKKMMEPIKDLPFSILINGLYGHKVLPFEVNDEQVKTVIPKLKEACLLACKNAFEKGIIAKRINEVGNYIEPFVLKALNAVGFKADRPLTKNGIHQSTGYPDIYFESENGLSFYFECKTYNKKSIDTTFRSFYVSPSKNPKIIKDAYHLMIGFEIVKEQRGSNEVYVPIHWKLYSLEGLRGQIKHEFNASNKDLYSLDTLIAEGNTSKTIQGTSLDDFL